MPTQIQKLINSSSNPKLISDVFEFTQQAYGDKKRPSGQTHLEHALNVASILSEMDLDPTTVAAGFLHDLASTSSVSPDKKAALEEIEKRFGADIAHIVERSSELKRVYYSFHAKTASSAISEQKAENIRKMFFAIAKDIRVIIIDLASRIDGLHHIAQLPAAMQKTYADETLQIFVPIANRLSLGDVRRQLEDLAFEFLDPKTFAWLKENMSQKYEERQKYLARFIPHFKKVLKHERILFSDVHYRAKSYWSTYQKLQRHSMDFEKLYDLVALRLIVKDVTNCYGVLGMLHKRFPPISGQIQDYIAKPKENGYQSLHTTVLLEPGRICEVQIKTESMHAEAEHGICAHWAYKEKFNLHKNHEDLAWSKEIPNFLKNFKIDFFSNQVFAFTPKGDVIVLPQGSTPIDFAYAVHSDVGNHCESAKIDGKIIPLNQALKNGDIVEIITNKNRKPSYDWMRFVKTGFAKSHIRKLITAIPVSLFSVPNFVKEKIVQISTRKEKKPKKIANSSATGKKSGGYQLHLAGQKGMMVTYAKCCNPKAQDPVKAYMTKYRSTVLHHTSCVNFTALSKKFPEKIIEASWEES
ncbi:HD domain-containing protein [Candidatus Parcubacteria bacterium]|nr:HD domain-containing protein [Candidatus Parcubacteria bacterium]